MRKIIFFIIIVFLIFSWVISFAKENKEKCFECHAKKREPKVLQSGEKMYLYVNPKEYKASVHAHVDCVFCHLELPTPHPKPIKIKSKREYRNRVAKNCIRCHPYSVISKSPSHAKIVKRKDVNCVDCHGAHNIKSIKEWKKTVSTCEYCIMCHKFPMVKTLASGEKIKLKVNKKEIKASVHAKLKCISCHKNFSKTKHPLYGFKSKSIYKAKLSKSICKNCHTDEKLKKNPAHYTLSKTAPCIECHNYHSVKPAKLVAVPVNKYCLNCHKREIKKKMESGEILSMKVSEEELLFSAHQKLKCNECHKGFSLTSHPVKTYKSIADFREKAQEICKNCHKKEVEEYKESVHALALKIGNKKAPDCLRCHDYHKVVKITTDKNLSIKICTSCHVKELNTFKESIHHEALLKGIKEAPVCASCHNAHKVSPIIVADLKENCMKCHKGVKKAHNKWLYNPPFRLESFVDLHFEGATCASCHTLVNKSVVLTLIDKTENKPLSIEKVAEILEVSPVEVKSKIDINGNNIIEEKELWGFLGTLKARIPIDIAEKLDVDEPNNAHKIVSKKKAIKDCTYCHHTKTDFTGKIEMAKSGFMIEKMDLDKSAINSLYAIPNIRDFYVITFGKMRILDTLFFLALLAGIAVPIGHISLRILMTPIRRKRKGG